MFCSLASPRKASFDRQAKQVHRATTPETKPPNPVEFDKPSLLRRWSCFGLWAVGVKFGLLQARGEQKSVWSANLD